MKRLLIALTWLAAAGLSFGAEPITIGQCVEMAVANYPAVKKYGLLESTRNIELADIDRSWLPRLGVYAQATAQNVVPSFPDALSDILDRLGQSPEGLGKLQYKVGADLTQPVWDGGVASARRHVARAETATQRSALDVEIYSVRQRVENLYFAILLAEEQIKINRNTLNLLNANIGRLSSMLRNGTAMQSDVDMLQARALTVEQSIDQARFAVGGYRRALGLFVGETLDDRELVRPEAAIPTSNVSDRPELRLLDSKLALTNARKRLSDTSLMPKIGLFAQAYYGYPGFDYFRSMMNRDLSFNIIAGIKVSWNIDAFYTRKNSARHSAIEAESLQADKDVFLFNSSVQTASVTEKIDGLRDVMAKDSRIIELQGNVRKAAESQLANGVIDATALLTKIDDENRAALTAGLHEIQLIQEIYNLKHILNR